MCTAVLSISPGLPVLLAGIRDELTGRAWQPPARHWPSYPDLVGGLDLLAGGTWLAVAPGLRRVGCVLNGRGVPAPPDRRRTRGALPLLAAAGRPLDPVMLADCDPFHLLTAEPGRATMHSWDGRRLTEHLLGPGLHLVVNDGLATVPAAGDGLASEPADGNAVVGHTAAGDGRAAELARISYFLPRFRAARRPSPRPGEPAGQAWGEWLPLINGAGLAPGDRRALIVMRTLPGGLTWGTTSISLVCLDPAAVRYDFTGRPGDPAAWQQVL